MMGVSIALLAATRASAMGASAMVGGGAKNLLGRGPLRMSGTGTSDAPLFCLNVCLRVKAARRADFLVCIRNNQKGTLSTEPLALAYVFGEDDTTPNTWHLFEKYRGREGFEAHTRTPHFKAWETFAASDPFTAPPRVDFYTLMGEGPPA
jgi:quinol monooxygenase YgiN